MTEGPGPRTWAFAAFSRTHLGGWSGSWRSEESFDGGRVRRPSVEQYRPGDLFGGVSECEGNDDDVVERSDDGEELGDEVDGREDPETSDADGHLGSSWYPWVLAEHADGGDARGQESCQFLEGALG